MAGNSKKDLLCKGCWLQFDTKDAYDSHYCLELSHFFFQQEVDDLYSNQEDNSFNPTGSVMVTCIF